MDANDNGNADPREAVPVLPWQIGLNNSVTHYRKRDDGGMVLCFTPGMDAPGGGFAMVPGPQCQIAFSPEAWERFQREVAADGVKSKIAVSRVVPPPR